MICSSIRVTIAIKMSDDSDFRDSLLWAESVVQDRQHNTKKKQETTSNLKIALYFFGIIVIICLLYYIINRAYNTPDPISILDEVRNMTNQLDASGVDD